MVSVVVVRRMAQGEGENCSLIGLPWIYSPSSDTDSLPGSVLLRVGCTRESCLRLGFRKPHKITDYGGCDKKHELLNGGHYAKRARTLID